MATLKNRRGSWYARVLWYGNTGKKKEKQIPLRTRSKVTARERLVAVNKVENDIKDGLSYTFPWMSDHCQTMVLRFSLSDAVTKWLKSKRSDGIRQSTVVRYERSLRSLMTIAGSIIPLENVDMKVIDTYREMSLQRELSPEGINLNLRSIKAFLHWCELCGYIPKVPHISMIKIPKKLPVYMPDRIFDKIIRLDWLDQKTKNAFWFYRETGVRLSEPFLGRLEGNLLLISGESTKQGSDKEVILSDGCLRILKEMIGQRSKSKGTLQTWTDKLSKTFLKAVREVDGKETRFHFHSLRHTFAVRRYLQTRDIYQVKKEMGHSTVTTTEIYAEFSLNRLQMDFPTLMVKEAKKPEIWQSGHRNGGHNWSFTTVNQGT